jgi:hypothetical protein
MEQTVQEKLSFISKLEAEHANCAENLVKVREQLLEENSFALDQLRAQLEQQHL